MSDPTLQPPGETVKLPDIMPVLPLKDVVTYPFIILPLSVGRDKSVLAVDQALAEHRVLMLLTQKSPLLDDPSEDDLPRFGTAASIMRMLKLPDGRLRILVQGVSRARVEHFSQSEPFLLAKVQPVEERAADESALEIQALVRSVKENLDHAVNLGKNISPEVMIIAANLDEPGRLADLAASNLDLEVVEAQRILETTSPFARLQRVSELLLREVQLLTMQQEISMQARGEMDKNQREFFLRQQLKTIQEELGEGEELASEIAGYRQRARERNLTEEALEELERQIRRLERGHPDSAESSVTRTYLDWLTGLPWRLRSEDHLDLEHARKVLDEDHYDLDKVKERIIEYLAVRKLNPESKGPILCFVGPPGVGKTSLGRSIARALGRKFVRLSLGGIRDEAEIRGHRRTYVGALPGRILQGIHQAGSGNPVFMLDEIDKIGADFRGDPSSALLEVLDPEQNSTFRDHYIGAAYDLSQVLFITTANLLDPIQPAFLDRMEVIRLSGYTAAEKQKIARRHLIPKQLGEHGLSRRQLRFTDAAVRRIIVDYTKEAGLRNLERELAAVCRKVAVKVAGGDDNPTSVTLPKVEELLGAARHFSEELLSRDRVGVATGLAWTAVGGDLLFIEVLSVAGKGKLVLTGQLGEVMKESAQAALSFARSRTGDELDPDFFARHDLHIHVPAGSVPKDGPSAGITIAAAIVSVLKDLAVDRRVAMSGEITLRGEVLPIGGIKEKVLAARSAGVRSVILPRLNRRDIGELAADLTQGLQIHYVDHMDEVLAFALPGFAGGPPSVPAGNNVTGEDRLIGWLRGQIRKRGEDFLGDDAAVLAASAPVVTVDQQIAGTHFPADLAPPVVARRLVAVSLSDLAAMGAEPCHAFLALTMPENFAPRPFFTALLAACDDHGVCLAGGDLARGPVLAASLTLAGRRRARGRIVHRSSARPGDAVWVGGTLGESAAGRRLVARGARIAGRGVRLPRGFSAPTRLRRAAARAVRRHLEPKPQLDLGRWLAGRHRAAAIDLSDGLAIDLHRLCRASGVGARIDAARLPMPQEFERLAARVDRPPARLALAGGEDYVLLFAMQPTLRPPARFMAHQIGEIVTGRRLTLQEDRRRRPLPPIGWDYFT